MKVRTWLRPGYNGWAGVAAVVVAAEALDKRTMSSAFEEARRHPIAGPAVCGFWAALTAHLFGIIPDRYDPFKRAFSMIAKVVAR